MSNKIEPIILKKQFYTSIRTVDMLLKKLETEPYKAWTQRKYKLISSLNKEMRILRERTERVDGVKTHRTVLADIKNRYKKIMDIVEKNLTDSQSDLKQVRMFQKGIVGGYMKIPPTQHGRYFDKKR